MESNVIAKSLHHALSILDDTTHAVVIFILEDRYGMRIQGQGQSSVEGIVKGLEEIFWLCPSNSHDKDAAVFGAICINLVRLDCQEGGLYILPYGHPLSCHHEDAPSCKGYLDASILFDFFNWRLLVKKDTLFCLL